MGGTLAFRTEANQVYFFASTLWEKNQNKTKNPPKPKKSPQPAKKKPPRQKQNKKPNKQTNT